MSRRAQSSVTDRAVYDGQSRLGDYWQHGDEYVARDQRGQVIGRFDTAHAAIEAILKAAARAS